MEMEAQGICVTCISAAKCVNYRNTHNAIWYCEEFECRTSFNNNMKQDKVGPESDKKRTVSSSANNNEGKHKGLCTNCENRKTCNLHIPESGVWHCEEYK